VEIGYHGEVWRFADGDVFEGRVVRRDGVLLLGGSFLVSAYRVGRPNGPDCEPTCRQPVNVQEL
jgi:hypothetical protein